MLNRVDLLSVDRVLGTADVEEAMSRTKKLCNATE